MMPNILLGFGTGLISLILLKKYSTVPDITSSLLSLNIGIYFLTSKDIFTASNTILYRFGSSGLYLMRGEYWTLITSMFLHANLIHLALNMYALYILGKAVEFSLGKKAYLVMYFFSGLVGNLASAILDPMIIGVGASGAIMGLLGYMVAMEYKLTGKLSSSTIFVALFVIFGGFSANVDVIAHAGGFVVGLIWGLTRRIERRYVIYY